MTEDLVPKEEDLDILKNEVQVVDKKKFAVMQKTGRQIVELVDDLKAASDEDFAFAREALRQTVEHAQYIAEEYRMIANVADNPRYLEVYNGFLQTIINGARVLVLLARDKQRIDNNMDENSGTNITNNNLIVTTADLGKIVKEMIKNNE